jgi:hypothetical protein
MTTYETRAADRDVRLDDRGWLLRGSRWEPGLGRTGCGAGQVGKGQPLLTGMSKQVRLDLLEAKAVRSGDVMLRYAHRNEIPDGIADDSLTVLDRR